MAKAMSVRQGVVVGRVVPAPGAGPPGRTSMAGGDYERAARVWSVLFWAALCRQTLTYSRLARVVGGHRQGVAYALGLVQRYCDAHGLDPLQDLVVLERTGEPSSGFGPRGTARTPGEWRERIFKNPMQFRACPTSADFQAVTARRKNLIVTA